jgi:pimeloyl-ACP methyl ester carboxylesterase
MKLFHRWAETAEQGEVAGQGEMPLVILHGLLGASGNWQTLGRRFSQGRPVLLVDQRNHGRSPHHPSHTYVDMAADLLLLLDELGLAQVDLLGHSMGGKTVMRFAQWHPERVNKLVVADIAPVAYETHHTALFDALNGLHLDRVQNRGEVDVELALKIDSPIVRMFLLKGLYRKEGGGFGFRFNLPVLRQHLTEVSGHLADERRIEAPTLAIYGGGSGYVNSRGLDAFKAQCTDFSAHCLKGAGHWLHAEDPDGFYKAVVSFLSQP